MINAVDQGVVPGIHNLLCTLLNNTGTSFFFAMTKLYEHFKSGIEMQPLNK